MDAAQGSSPVRGPATQAPPSTSGTGPRLAYGERLAAAREALRVLDRKGAIIANLRVVTFLGAVVLFGATVFEKLPDWGHLAALASFAGYVALAWRHHHVLKEEERARIRVSLNERGLLRLDGKWHDFADRGERFLDGSHLYAPDLDVFGQGSLFQRIDETATRAGEERLAQYLLAPAPLELAQARQGAVRELSARLTFRQELVVESRLAAKEKANPGQFLDWAEGPDTLSRIRWARPLAWLLPLATLTVFLGGRFGLWPGVFTWVGILLQLGVVLATRVPLAELYARISLGERGFVRFEETFARIEREPLEDPLLRRVLGPLAAGSAEPVSRRLARFSRWFGFAELRQSTQMHGVINLLLLWDLQFLFRLDDWRKAHGAQVRSWFDALAELEALCCLAGLAHDRPDFVFPELVPGPARFEATALWHPLLEQAVPNDVSLVGPSAGLVITGSNMSGKTTLLRAMGLNAVLAQAGAPVAARSLRLSTLHVLTSMRVKDSLERGVSYFYAEVQRIKAVLDAATREKGQALFLLDEILLGTNTRERQLASRELLVLLWRTGAIGGVATHDLLLANLAEEPGLGVRNVHFEDQLVGDEMKFDYRMREGVVHGTNALRVLKKAGIPISES